MEHWCTRHGKLQVLINLTWQDVRDVRDRQLHETDAKVGHVRRSTRIYRMNGLQLQTKIA